MNLLFCLTIIIIFLTSGCSHIQKVHYYNSKTIGSPTQTEQSVFKEYRSNGCAIFPMPWDINSSQSKVKVTDAGEEFQLGVTSDLAPLRFWSDVYWWGPLWLPIVPTFLFTEKTPPREMSIEIRYQKNWKTEFKENDTELRNKRVEEIRSTAFPHPSRVVIRYVSEKGSSESLPLQGDDIKSNDSDSLYYRYKFILANAIPEIFEVDVEINSKTYTFILQNQEHWHFAIYPPFYCGLN